MRVVCDCCGCLMEVGKTAPPMSLSMATTDENGRINNNYILCPECREIVFEAIRQEQEATEELERDALEEEQIVIDEPDLYKENLEDKILEELNG